MTTVLIRQFHPWYTHRSPVRWYYQYYTNYKHGAHHKHDIQSTYYGHTIATQQIT
jgi:hypothetical protein